MRKALLLMCISAQALASDSQGVYPGTEEGHSFQRTETTERRKNINVDSDSQHNTNIQNRHVEDNKFNVHTESQEGAWRSQHWNGEAR